MANLVQELLIKIGLKADTSQGQQVANTVEKIGGSAKQAGTGLGAVSKEVGDAELATRIRERLADVTAPSSAASA